jgi:hypothetical protein
MGLRTVNADTTVASVPTKDLPARNDDHVLIQVRFWVAKVTMREWDEPVSFHSRLDGSVNSITRQPFVKATRCRVVQLSLPPTLSFERLGRGRTRPLASLRQFHDKPSQPNIIAPVRGTKSTGAPSAEYDVLVEANNKRRSRVSVDHKAETLRSAPLLFGILSHVFNRSLLPPRPGSEAETDERYENERCTD